MKKENGCIQDKTDYLLSFMIRNLVTYYWKQKKEKSLCYLEKAIYLVNCNRKWSS